MTDNGDPAQQSAGQWSYDQAHLPPAVEPDAAAGPAQSADHGDAPIFGTTRTGAIPPVGTPGSDTVADASPYDQSQYGAPVYGAPVYGSPPPEAGEFGDPAPEALGRHSQFGSDGFPDVHYYARPGSDPSQPAAPTESDGSGPHVQVDPPASAAQDGPNGPAGGSDQAGTVPAGSYPSAEFGTPFGLPPAPPFYADAGQHDQAQHDQAQHDQAQHDQAQHDQGQPDPGQPDQGQRDQGQSDQGRQRAADQYGQGQPPAGQHARGQYDQNQYQYDPSQYDQQYQYDQNQYVRDPYARDPRAGDPYGRDAQARDQYAGGGATAFPPTQYAPGRGQDPAVANVPPSADQQRYEPNPTLSPAWGTPTSQPGPQQQPAQPNQQQPNQQQPNQQQPNQQQPNQQQPNQQQPNQRQPNQQQPNQQQPNQQQPNQQQPNQPQPGQAPNSLQPSSYGTPAPAPDPSRPRGPLPTAAQPRPESLLVPSHRATATQAAQFGWQGRIRRLTAGAIKPQPSAQELADRKDRQDIQRTFSRPMTIVVVQPKGGAGKTPATIALASALGAHRGGYVVGWDDNETRGTLAVRVDNADKQTTTVWDLLRDLSMFERTNARVGDLSHYVRSQGAAQFDALVSDDSPGNMAQIGESEFKRIHTVLQRFYRQIVVDTGNNVRSPNWQAAVNAADQIVVVSTYQRDVGYSGSWVLDHLIETGRAELAAGAITVLSAADPRADPAVRRELIEHFGARTRAVVEIPYDPLIALGGPIEWVRLKPETRRAWTHAGASVVTALAAHDEAERLATRNPG